MPTTIADAPAEVLQDVWGVDEKGRPIRLFRKPRPTVWGLTADGKPDPQEDDEPVESLFAHRQCQLLTDALICSWLRPNREPFLIVGNMGLFFEPTAPPLVPDTMLSLDIPPSGRMGSDDAPRSYIVWEMGKLPEVVFEFVSKTTNDEDGIKLEAYERIGIPYYVVFDPCRYLGGEILQVFRLIDGAYERVLSNTFVELGLGVKLWKGRYQDESGLWLRWCDAQGGLLATAEESKLLERRRADEEHRRAEDALKAFDEESKRTSDALKLADEERQKNRRASELLDQARAKLRELGIEF